MNTDQSTPPEKQHGRRAHSAAALDDAEVADRLQQLHGWERDGATIHRTFGFEDFHQTVAFVNAVAWIAHREDHHPDLQVSYKTCRVQYTTHSAGGLTRNDFACAAQVDALI